MEYEIRLFDEPLLRFDADPKAVDANYKISWVTSNTSLLPYSLEPTPESLASWIRRRTIPKNRAFVDTFLARNGLNTNRPLAIIDLCKGLSLNDCYWITKPGDREKFEKVNLFDNRLSRLLAQVAFTGYGSKIHSGFISSPEYTTNGMLPKCWRRIDKNIYLYKGGTSGFANAGFEPYSEYYAADIARQMGVDHVEYELHTWKGVLCSSCKLFTSKEKSYVPAASVITSGGFNAVVEHYSELGMQFMQALSDMLAFDAIICNTDRHMNNYGFLADSKTNEIIAPAPLFDHGNSLLHQAYGDDWSSVEALESYAAAQDACMYGDFFDVAKGNMTHETRAKVRGLVNFSFDYGPKKGFPKHRLDLIQELIRKRARTLID